MLAGPIFRAEMVSAARRDRYFWLRVLYAAIILFVLWAVYADMNFGARPGGAAGGISISERARAAAYFFIAFSWVQLIGLLLVAPAMAVGTIATERERKTIEYLFATDLSNAEIVLGKTLARLLLVAKFALVSLPILFLFRLLGGIPASVVAASFLVAGSTALLITAFSVCISVWSKQSRDASIRVYLALAALLILPPLLGMILGFSLSGSPWWSLVQPAFEFLTDLNPIWVLGQSMGAASGLGVGFDSDPVVRMAAWHAAISLALVALATLAVRRVHLREASRGSIARGWRPDWLRLPSWRPQLGARPVLWKEAFAPTARTRLGVVGVVASAAIGASALGLIIYGFFQIVDRGVSYSTPARQFCGALGAYTGILGSGILLLAAARASGVVTIEKERDCWTSLISTPLTGAEVVVGKTLGNLYALRWGFALLAFGWGLGLLIDVSLLLPMAASALAFFACCWFLTELGLYYSFRSATSLRALGFTVAVGATIGGLYMFCCCPIAAVGGGPPDEIIVLGLAPNMPFLMVSPWLAFAEGLSSDDESIFGVAAAILGNLGYLLGAAVMTASMAQKFDALAGRATGKPEMSKMPSAP